MMRRFARLESRREHEARDGARDGAGGGSANASASARWVELKDGAAYVLDGAPWEGAGQTGQIIEGVATNGVATRGWRRLAPATPSKIVCVGRNYRAHAAELGHDVPPEPLLFFKPPSSVIGPDDEVELPPAHISERIEHEVELALVIGTRIRRASPAQARAAIFGWLAACDVTARDLQKKDGQWARAKGMDTFCPLGPVLVTGLAIEDALALRCSVNGVSRQDGTTRDMVFRPAELVAYASAVMTLEPGDVVLTGTPSGVGPLGAGDELAFEVENIGRVVVPVRGAPSET